MNVIKPVCLQCNKKIVPLGNRRKNGNPIITDWIDRKYHKKCFEILMRLEPNIVYAERVF